MRRLALIFSFGAWLALAPAARAQENYFVTYSHQMEEPGNLEIGVKSVSGFPKAGNSFVGTSFEFEYGAKAWWTTELYLDGQATANENVTFAGWRWENRFRPLLEEHWINPVLYVEYEGINGSNRSLLGIVGHDCVDEFSGPGVRAERAERKRELELRLILSSNFKGWNVSGNFISERNFAEEGAPWEFGYAVGVSRPLTLKASAQECIFCRENFALGAEMYGGLGDTSDLSLGHTAHYLAPTLSFRMPKGLSFRVSPGFGLNDHSNGVLLLFGVWYEVEQIFARKK